MFAPLNLFAVCLLQLLCQQRQWWIRVTATPQTPVTSMPSALTTCSLDHSAPVWAGTMAMDMSVYMSVSWSNLMSVAGISHPEGIQWGISLIIAHAQARYTVLCVCVCVCLSVSLSRLLQLLNDQWSARKSFYRLLVRFSWIGFEK